SPSTTAAAPGCAEQPPSASAVSRVAAAMPRLSLVDVTVLPPSSGRRRTGPHHRTGARDRSCPATAGQDGSSEEVVVGAAAALAEVVAGARGAASLRAVDLESVTVDVLGRPGGGALCGSSGHVVPFRHSHCHTDH